MNNKPPIGIKPYFIWIEENPNPTIKGLLERYIALNEAVVRYRSYNLNIKVNWLEELGVI